MHVKGIVVLDIDGTVTDRSHHIPEEVRKFLKDLSKEWAIGFITGRTFTYGYQSLKPLDFPYYFAVFNGAILLEMPAHRVVNTHNVPVESVPKIIRECTAVGIDPLFHTADTCYWRPERHDPETRAHLEKRRDWTEEHWIAVDNFEEVGRKKLAYAKIFGPREKLLAISNHLDGLATTVIGDPLREGHGVMLVTHPSATKGGTLRDLKEIVGKKVPTIAAGDDYNDLSMIEEADVGIFMETAPEELKDKADLIGPPASERGIIAALTEAMERVR